MRPRSATAACDPSACHPSRAVPRVRALLAVVLALAGAVVLGGCLRARYSEADGVVPGHGAPGEPVDLLDHTHDPLTD